MGKQNNIYIKKARRKRLIKRTITFTIISIILVLLIMFKTNIFIIKNISSSGDNLITKEYVLKTMEQYKGENIFAINKNEIIRNVKNNPYVKNIEITRKFPGTLNINIEEAKGLYYYYDGDYYCIVTNDLIVLEKKDNVENDDLIEISGFDVSISRNLGEQIQENNRITTLLDELYQEQNVIKEKNEDFKITKIDISNMSNINIYLNNIQVIIGSDENVRSKMSNAILIYKTGLPKEYINVGFNGTPDFK